MYFKRKLKNAKCLFITADRRNSWPQGSCWHILPAIEVGIYQDTFFIDFSFWDFTLEIWVGPQEFTPGGWTEL